MTGLRRTATLVSVTTLLVGGCVSSVHPQPSPAALEARARAARAAAPQPRDCSGMNLDEVEVVFPYAETTLLEEARAQLMLTSDWLRCNEGGRVRLSVENEHHYREPDYEAELRRARAGQATAFLRDQGVPPERIIAADGVSGDGPVLMIRLRGRGW